MLKDEISTIFLAVYVDDIIIATNNIGIMENIKSDIVKLFKMKDMGAISYCLGIEFQQNLKNGTITMSQKKFTEEILIRFGMENSKPVLTPNDGNQKLKKPETEGTNEEFPYQSLIGSIMYLSVSTRPDITHAAIAIARSANSTPTIRKNTGSQQREFFDT